MKRRPQLDALAQRIAPKATWDDIALPADDRALLRRMADQIEPYDTVAQDRGVAPQPRRRPGMHALFLGQGAAAKMMAAEAIASHLSLALYRIDLSAVISKFIGETEKALRRVFDAAEGGGAILFFDEADALFGKRTEVKDSHDRYANIEINDLLQQIEAFGGLAILATNREPLYSTFVGRRWVTLDFP